MTISRRRLYGIASKDPVSGSLSWRPVNGGRLLPSTQYVANGSYAVTVSFVAAKSAAEGARFDVRADGAVVVSGVDVVGSAGYGKVRRVVFPVTVTSGKLRLDFPGVTSGIVLLGVSLSTLPAAVVAAGYSRLTFADDFDSMSTIDVAGTGGPGFLWYTKGTDWWAKLPTEALSVVDSVLTIDQRSGPASWGLFSTSGPTGNGAAFKFAYFEARMSFDPADAPGGTGWPAFWTLSRDQICGANGPEWAELDVFEAYHDKGGPFGGYFVGTLHDCFRYPEEHALSSTPNNLGSIPGTDFRSFHDYGVLWEKGRVTWFFDGREVIRQDYSGTPSPNPNNHPAGTFEILDNEGSGMAVIIGAGVNFPMHVDRVRVWQK